MSSRLRWLLCVALVSTSSAVASVTIQDVAAGGGALGGIAAAGPDIVARRAWVTHLVGNGDDVASPGEHLNLHVSLRNAGFASAENARVSLRTDDAEVALQPIDARYGQWAVGDTRAPTFPIIISAGATPHDVIVVATVTASNGGPWQFLVTFTIAAPPLEFVKLGTWVDDPTPGGDGDGQAAPGERLQVGVRLQNVGAADGTDVRVGIVSLDPDVSIVVADATHPTWPAGEERETLFLIDIAPAASTRHIALFITVETDGADMWQFSMSVPIVGEEPGFELRSFWLYDPAPGGNRDGLATPGERLLPRFRLRNVGTGDGEDVRVTLASLDADISVAQGIVSHATWPAGVSRNNAGLVIDVAPAASPSVATLVATVTTADGGTWEFTVTVDIGMPRVAIEHRRSWLFDPTPGGNRDGVASPGERVLPRVRLRQSGPSTAHNVNFTLEIDDPDVAVRGQTTTYATWSPGSALTLTSFVVDISREAVPHDVMAVIHVSSDDGGPWEFPFVFPIAYRAVDFVQRSGWVFDPTPGGHKDGQAEAGERVFPRIRLRHVGTEDATTVTVRLTTSDPDITVETGEVTHNAWPAGTARNNVGFVVDISPLTAPRDVDFVVTVTADGATWSYPYGFAVTSPPAHLAVEDAWVQKPNSGIRPGEWAQPGLRLRSIGTEPVTGLTATLVATDEDLILKSFAATRDTMLPGDQWEITSFRLRVAADAIPHDTAVVVIIVAENGGPWRVEIPIPMRAKAGLQVTQQTWVDDRDSGGNEDGVANPGETADLVIEVKNYRYRTLTNVRMVATVDDPAIAVTGVLVDTVDTWPASAPRRRTFRFTAAVDAEAEWDPVDVTLTITADDADPVVYVWTIPIVGFPPEFEFRTAWVRDPAPGADGNRVVNPGETVHPRVRIKNVGQGTARNVHASLVILDNDVTVASDSVFHDSWPVGEGRNNNGFVLEISPGATAHDVQAVLSVVAEDSGPWTFPFTFPTVASSAGGVTALLANFPNPFNPETWIPFDLAEDADVTVSVYDARGALTRRLDLGRLLRGAYRGRSSAAYWDGRNDVGERVSSGLYLYELRAGSHREVRRMIVRK